MHQPLDFKSLDEHKERFETERKRLTVDYQEMRNKKMVEIKKENVEIIKTLRGLSPRKQEKKNVHEDLDTSKETLKTKFRANPS